MEQPFKAYVVSRVLSCSSSRAPRAPYRRWKKLARLPPLTVLLLPSPEWPGNSSRIPADLLPPLPTGQSYQSAFLWDYYKLALLTVDSQSENVLPAGLRPARTPFPSCALHQLLPVGHPATFHTAEPGCAHIAVGPRLGQRGQREGAIGGGISVQTREEIAWRCLKQQEEESLDG